MELRAGVGLVLLAQGLFSQGLFSQGLFSQEVGQERWRSELAAANEFKSQGRFAESEQTLWTAIEEARRFEPDLAPAATTYNDLAGLYQDTGRCGEAAQAYRRSLDLWHKVGPRGDTYLLRTANHLVGLHLECGEVKAAEAEYRAAIAPRIAARDGRYRDSDVAHALSNLGSIDYRKHRYSESRRHFEEAIAIRERLPGEPSREMGVLLINHAFALVRGGEVDRALAQVVRGIDLIEWSAGRQHALLVSAMVSGANVCLEARRWPEGEALFGRALSLARSMHGEDHPLTATAMSGYAVLLRGTHRKAEAAVLESRAGEIRRRWLQSSLRQTVDARTLSQLK